MGSEISPNVAYRKFFPTKDTHQLTGPATQSLLEYLFHKLRIDQRKVTGYPVPNHLSKIMGKGKAGAVYAVARGRTVGMFQTWDECKAQVDGFQNARYKKFPSSEEAQAFIEEHRMPGSYKAPTTSKAPSASTGSKSFVQPSSTFNASSSRTGGAGIHQSRLKTGTILLASVPSVPRQTAQKRSLTKTSLKVTEDRVVNKRAKMSTDAPNSRVDLTNFAVDEDGYVVVFTDGACTKNGRVAAKAGIGVWFGHGHNLNISEPVHGRQTNNTAEIQAAERAIKQAKENGINKLKVKTDSQFTINCVTKWLPNWRRNNWRLSSGGDVKNKEDLMKLDSAMQNMEIKWSYVAGHAGIEGNEAADRLAVAGAEHSKAHF